MPLIVSWKGKTPVGGVRDQLIDFTDMKATLFDLVQNHRADSAKDLVLDGISFLPTIKGGSGLEREWVFCHYDPRWGRFRGQRSAFAYDGRVKVYHDGRVIDVAKDVMEQNPLADDAISPAVLAQLRSALAQHPAFPAEESEFQQPHR